MTPEQLHQYIKEQAKIDKKAAWANFTHFAMTRRNDAVRWGEMRDALWILRKIYADPTARTYKSLFFPDDEQQRQIEIDRLIQFIHSGIQQET